MIWQYTPYVIPLLLAAAVSVGMAYYARRRAAAGATTFALLMLTVAGWSVGYALELGFVDLPGKLLWAKVEYAAIVALPLAWLAFALVYTQQGHDVSPVRWAMLAVIPAITLTLVWTNQFHGLIWRSTALDFSGPFVALEVTYGPWFWVHSAYSYLLLFFGTAWFIFMLLRSPHLYRQQAAVLLLGVLAPWLGNGLYLAGASPITHLDITPFAFTISGIAFALGLIRFRLLDIVPVARRAVLDGLADGVMVLDRQNRVVDMNPAFRQIIGPAAAAAIGRPVAHVLADYAGLLERYRGVTEARDEITLPHPNGLHYFDLHLSPLTDHHDRPIGRVVTLHDITARKEAEIALRSQKELFESLVAVARATTQQPTLQATLQNALDVVARLTHAEMGSILLFDQNETVTHHLSAFGRHTPAQTPEYLRQVMAQGLAGWVVRRRHAAIAANTQTDDRWLPLPDDYPIAVRSALAVPVFSGPNPVGVLTLTHTTEGHFTPEHMNLMQAAADHIALALRNAQIFDAQRAMAGRQITLYEVLRVVAGKTDPDHVTRAAVETIAQFAGWPHIAIAAPTNHGDSWQVRAAKGSLAALTGKEFPMARNVVGQTFVTGERRLVTLSENSAAAISGNSATQTVLTVPMRRGHTILGVLALESDQPNGFDTDDALLAESLAEAIALTLDNARLYAETQRRLTEQTALQEAGAAITSSLDLDAVLSSLAEQLGRALDVTSTYIYSYEPESMTATVLAEYFGPAAGTAEAVSDLNSTYNLSQDFSNLVPFLRAGQPGLNHLENLSPAQNQAHFGAKTTLTLPVQVRGETIAFAQLRESRRRRDFSPDEIALGQGIARQAAIAIEHARFYDETRQQAAGLSALYTVTRMVNQSLVLKEVLSQALSSMLLSLGFEAGVVSLVNPVTGKLQIEADYGMPTKLLNKLYAAKNLDHTLYHHVNVRQEPLALDNLRRDAPVDVSDLVKMGFQSYAGIPLVHRQQALGSLSLFSREPRHTTSGNLALLSTIANQVAVAVTNARLFQSITDERSRLQALIEASRDGVVLVGMDRRVLVTNATAIELMGLPGQPEDWTDRPLMDAMAHLRPYAPAVVQATLKEMRRIRTGNESAGIGEYSVAGRTILWQNLPVLTGNTALGRLITMRDITQERQLEKMRDDLTHTMVHDLRNPLTAIGGSLQLIGTVANNLLPPQQHMLTIAQNRTAQMVGLVNSILDVSRLESGKMPVKSVDLPLDMLIAETVQAQSPLALEKNLKVDIRVEPDLPPGYADAALMSRVLQNLVGNAIKFTPRDGQITITAGFAPNATGYLQVSIADTGPGLPPDLQRRLFEKFVTGRREESGSGLGLAFCKLAVEAHGGQIWVSSRPDHGATFSFTLPVSSRTQTQPG